MTAVDNPGPGRFGHGVVSSLSGLDELAVKRDLATRFMWPWKSRALILPKFLVDRVSKSPPTRCLRHWKDESDRIPVPAPPSADQREGKIAKLLSWFFPTALDPHLDVDVQVGDGKVRHLIGLAVVVASVRRLVRAAVCGVCTAGYLRKCNLPGVHLEVR